MTDAALSSDAPATATTGPPGRVPPGPGRILLLSRVFPPQVGGSGRWLWEIYRRLPRHQVVIAAGEDPRQGEFDARHDLTVARLPLHPESWGLCDPRGVRGYARALRGLLPLVWAHRIDEVHCGCCLPEGLMGLALRIRTGRPYVCYVHGEELGFAAASRELGWLSRRVLRHARYLIANSRNTGRILVERWGLPAGRIRVLHPGVDVGRFAPAARDRAARARLGWGDRPVVLTVGRLQRRKGHDQMIRALAAVRRAVPDVLYAILGDGEERPALQGLVAGEGLGDHVQFLGERDDATLVSCYQQCDLFVLPNRQVGQDIEGFGMVLLEAQACGTPVVAGASGGTAETMQVPETGLIVPCEGPDRLAAAVAELLSDPERLARMGSAARRRAVAQFDWDVLGRQAEQVFRDGRPVPP
jgi:phosphatidylinositol alpha-1,6-mannosyltransferase